MFEITSENFDKEVGNFTGKLMLKFGADWCMPCRMLDKTISQMKQDIRIVKVDIENSPKLAKQYNISSIPAVLFFNEGKLKERKIGLMKEQDIIDIINRI